MRQASLRSRNKHRPNGILSLIRCECLELHWKTVGLSRRHEWLLVDSSLLLRKSSENSGRLSKSEP